MSVKSKGPFDAQVFLASAGVSRKIVEYPLGTNIFKQGDPCDHVLYIQIVNFGAKKNLGCSFRLSQRHVSVHCARYFSG